MNIHKYNKQISDLLLEGSRLSEGKSKTKKKVYYPGCYIISRTLTHNLFKLGEAHGKGGLYNRIIGQYKICMSLKTTEFFMRYLVIAHRRKEGNKFFSQILEKALLKTIDSEVPDSYSKEYIFTPDQVVLEKKMAVVLKTHKEYYSVAIKFTPKGFCMYDEVNGFNTRPQTFKELPNLNPDVVLLLGLSKPRPKTKPKKPIVYKMRTFKKLNVK